MLRISSIWLPSTSPAPVKGGRNCVRGDETPPSRGRLETTSSAGGSIIIGRYGLRWLGEFDEGKGVEFSP